MDSVSRCDGVAHLPDHHAFHSLALLDQDVRPSITVEGNYHHRIEVILEWVGHLHVPDLDEGGVQGTPAFMRQQLEGLRRGAAEFIVPEIAPGRLLEMRCFDPNQCVCLRYEGMGRLPHG